MLERLIKRFKFPPFFKKILHLTRFKFKFPKIKFPHIPRVKPAGNFFTLGKFLLLFALLLIFFLNLFTIIFSEPTYEEKLVEQVLQNPSSIKLHMNLGDYYFQSGREQQAEKEYTIAQELFQQNQSLQKDNQNNNSPWWQWLRKKTAETKLRQEVAKWEKIAVDFPDYLHAKLKLAVLYYNLGEKNKAFKLVNQVIQTDPGDETAISLYEVLK